MKNLWKDIGAYVRREPWTVLMVVVLTAAMTASWFAAHAPVPSEAPAPQAAQPAKADDASGRPAAEASSGRAETANPYSEAQRLATTRRIEEMENKVFKDPKLRMVLGAAVLLVLIVTLCGLAWGVIWFLSIRRGERWMGRFGAPRPGWGIHDVFKAVVLMFFLDLVFSSALAYLFSLAGLKSPNLALMAGALLRSVVLVFYLGWIARKRQGGWPDLGICGRRPWAQAGWGLAGYLAMIPVYLLVLGIMIVVLNLFQIQAPVQAPVQVFFTETNQASVIGFAFFMGILGPLFEEIFFRGFLYPAFRSRAGVFRGMLISSAVFAALHGHGIAFVPIFVLGFALHLLYENTGSIFPGAVLHMTHNSAMLVIAMIIRHAIR